jgi:hypothetical protein
MFSCATVHHEGEAILDGSPLPTPQGLQIHLLVGANQAIHTVLDPRHEACRAQDAGLEFQFLVTNGFVVTVELTQHLGCLVGEGTILTALELNQGVSRLLEHSGFEKASCEPPKILAAKRFVLGLDAVDNTETGVRIGRQFRVHSELKERARRRQFTGNQREYLHRTLPLPRRLELLSCSVPCPAQMQAP